MATKPKSEETPVEGVQQNDEKPVAKAAAPSFEYSDGTRTLVIPASLPKVVRDRLEKRLGTSMASSSDHQVLSYVRSVLKTCGINAVPKFKK